MSLKKAGININNKDDKCFKYGIQCGSHKMYWTTHPENFHHYENIEDDLHVDGIKFPANNDTDKFEHIQNVSLNMFEVDDENEQTVISRKLFKKDAECHIDVLRVDEYDNGHYVYIRML